MGTNAKVLLELDHRVTHFGRTPRSRWSGEFYDARVDTWSSTLAQAGRGSVLTVYSGGRVGASYAVSRAHGIAPAPGRTSHARRGRPRRAAPPLRATRGRAWVDAWVHDPHAHGSYAAFRPGSSPASGASSGSPSTASTSPASTPRCVPWAILDGAVESGRRAAREVLAGI